MVIVRLSKRNLANNLTKRNHISLPISQGFRNEQVEEFRLVKLLEINSLWSAGVLGSRLL